MQRYWFLSVLPTVLWRAFPTLAIINTSQSELSQCSGGSNGVSEKLIHADCLLIGTGDQFRRASTIGIINETPRSSCHRHGIRFDIRTDNCSAGSFSTTVVPTADKSTSITHDGLHDGAARCFCLEWIRSPCFHFSSSDPGTLDTAR